MTHPLEPEAEASIFKEAGHGIEREDSGRIQERALWWAIFTVTWPTFGTTSGTTGVHRWLCLKVFIGRTH